MHLQLVYIDKASIRKIYTKFRTIKRSPPPVFQTLTINKNRQYRAPKSCIPVASSIHTRNAESGHELPRAQSDSRIPGPFSARFISASYRTSFIRTRVRIPRGCKLRNSQQNRIRPRLTVHAAVFETSWKLDSCLDR